MRHSLVPSYSNLLVDADLARVGDRAPETARERLDRDQLNVAPVALLAVRPPVLLQVVLAPGAVGQTVRVDVVHPLKGPGVFCPSRAGHVARLAAVAVAVGGVCGRALESHAEVGAE